MTSIDTVDFLVHNFFYYPQSYVVKLLIAYNRILNSLSLNDWINILKAISGSVLALYTCISFSSKFLGINLLNTYLNFTDINDSVKANVANYFNERKALLWPDKCDIKRLQYTPESIGHFKVIHDNLIAEGAKSMDVILLWDL